MNRVALVTGSTSGIGLAIAGRFLGEGISVAFHGLEPDGPDIAREYRRRYGVATWHSPANLLEAAACRDLVDEAAMALGPIDILVNNAGMQHVAPIDDFPAEKWNQVMALNLSAPFFLAQAVWPGMKRRGRGRILNIASVHGLCASEHKAAYVAAKHGLVGLTKALALEGAPVGITANAICPGWVRTPLAEKQLREQAASRGVSEAEVITQVMLQKQPVKEFVSVEAIAEMAWFLASERASATTGASFVMDGGWTAQ